MKTKTTYLFSLFLVVLTTNLFSQTPGIVKDWDQHFGVQDSLLENRVAEDHDGNVYTAGFTMNASSGADILVTKHSKDGHVVWTQQYSGAGANRDQATCIAVDGQENVYVGGFTYTSTANMYDFILLKYDLWGTVQWMATYNGTASNNDAASAILLLGTDVYLTGASTDATTNIDYKTIKYDQASGTQQWVATYDYANLYDIPFGLSSEGGNVLIVTGGSQNSLLDWDYATVYYDLSGNQLDAARSQGLGSGFDRALAVKSDAQNNVYITGVTVTSNGTLDMKTLKMDANGNTVWVRQYDYAGGDDIANDLLIDATGNVYVCGQGKASSNNDDYILLKYNSSGTLLWHKRYDAAGRNDAAKKMAFDGLGNVVLTGEASRDQYYDFLTIAYKSDGTELWHDFFDGTDHLDDKASDIKTDATGTIYVSGQSTVNSSYEYITIKYRTDYYTSVPDSEPSLGSFAFYPNTGQLLYSDRSDAKDIGYYTLSHYPKLYFTDYGVSYVFASINHDSTTVDTLQRVDMRFAGSENFAKAYPVNEEKTNGYLNYFLPQCPKGIIDVFGYQQLIYKNVYDGIDVEFSSNNEGMKFSFIISPNADATKPGLRFYGADAINIISNWSLQIASSLGTYEYDKPRVYQIDNSGNRIQLSWQCSYQMLDATTAGFTLGSYDHSKPLVIEVERVPSINTSSSCDWSTFLGTPNEDKGVVIKIDNNSKGYVTGSTTSNSLFPTFTGVGTITNAGSKDVFVLKFDQTGAPLFETFIGGSNDDIPFGMDLNSNLDIFLTGETRSTDLTTTGGNSENGISDAFICKLSNNGTSVPFLIYFGGDAEDKGMDVALDNNDNLYVVGVTQSSSAFPTHTKSGAYNQSSTTANASTGSSDAFIAEFDNTNTQVWGSFFGGDGEDNFSSIKAVENGSVLIAGSTNSMNAASSNASNTPCGVPNSAGDFPDCDPGNNFFHHLYNGDPVVQDQDAIIVKFNSSGQLIWSTYFGGKGSELVFAPGIIGGDFPFRNSLAVDPTNSNVFYLSGQTSKFTGFPSPTTSSGTQYVQQPSFVGSSPRAFIARFDTGILKWSTLFGAGSKTEGFSLTMDNHHNVYMGGFTGINSYSSDLCTVPSSPNTTFPNCSVSGVFHQSSYGGNLEDGFIACFNSTDNLTWCTYYGGSGNDEVYSLAADNNGGQNKLYLTGLTQSTSNFPLFDPATGNFQQPANAGGTNNRDGFIARFCSLEAIGIDEISSQAFSLTVFPNPTSGNISFELEREGKYTLEVYDCIGQQMHKEEVKTRGGEIYNLNLSTFANGIYFIRLASKEKIYNAKFIISK